MSALVLAGVLVAGALVASRTGAGGPLNPQSSVTTEASKVIKLVAAQDFDPEAGDGEHPAEAPLVIDGDQTTAWTTERYQQQFPRLKPGVGIWVDLGEPRRIGTVKVVSAEQDWEAEIRVSTDPKPPTRADGFKDGAKVSAGQPAATLDTDVRRVLVWITKLPPGLQMTVAEIQVSAK